MTPRLTQIKGGWAAVADRWAVFGETQQEAITKFQEAEERHKAIDSREIPLLSVS